MSQIIQTQTDRKLWLGDAYFGDKIDADGKGDDGARERRNKDDLVYLQLCVLWVYLITAIAFCVCGVPVVVFKFNPQKVSCQMALVDFE